MARLFFASLVTLTLIAGMLAGVVIAAFVASGSMDLGFALLLTAVINILLFLVSPWLTDLSLRWINRLTFLEDGELRARYPHVHALIHEVAGEYRFKAPSVGIIPDRNPTAFTYGHGRSSARIVLTEGLFEFLSEDETRAVVAHELGHIVHRDFIVMTIAGMLVQMLYQVYASLKNVKPSSSKDQKGSYLVVIAIVSWVLYQIGIYILLYLSRTREYLADSFAAERVEARHLANALVKIAYGIASAADSDQTRSLLASTRHLGVVDFKGARHLGLAAENAKSHGTPIAAAMLFDCYNPWAKLIELASTHPLTGKRILALGAEARRKGQAFDDIDIEAAAKRSGLDQGELTRRFLSEAGTMLMPWLLALATAALGALHLAPAAWAVGSLMLVRWRFPGGAAQPTTVHSLMSDWQASPVRGRRVMLQGSPIGRVDAGSAFGEDLIFADKSGRMATDFRSMLGPIGDLFAGWKRVERHIGASGTAEGWFRRSMGGYVILASLKTSAGELKARPAFWAIAFPIIVILATIVFLIVQPPVPQ